MTIGKLMEYISSWKTNGFSWKPDAQKPQKQFSPSYFHQNLLLIALRAYESDNSQSNDGFEPGLPVTTSIINLGHNSPISKLRAFHSEPLPKPWNRLTCRYTVSCEIHKTGYSKLRKLGKLGWSLHTCTGSKINTHQLYRHQSLNIENTVNLRPVQPPKHFFQWNLCTPLLEKLF